VLTGIVIHSAKDAEIAGKKLIDQGAKAVLIKGGHLKSSKESRDILITRDHIEYFTLPRLPRKDVHGTGCSLASAIACNVAKGEDLHTAITHAKTFVHRAIEHAYSLGKGSDLLQLSA